MDLFKEDTNENMLYFNNYNIEFDNFFNESTHLNNYHDYNISIDDYMLESETKSTSKPPTPSDLNETLCKLNLC